MCIWVAAVGLASYSPSPLDFIVRTQEIWALQTDLVWAGMGLYLLSFQKSLLVPLVLAATIMN